MAGRSPALSPAQLQRVSGGWRVKTEDGVHLDVRPMLHGRFRLAEVPQSDERNLWRYWCYSSFEAAVLGALVWPVSPVSEPVGYLRKGGARP